jgi:hypothetical protein
MKHNWQVFCVGVHRECGLTFFRRQDLIRVMSKRVKIDETSNGSGILTL